ncbi:MAG: hypothetical protein SGJ20_09685 [Planctomycetota bacterium]|nr:hypothetical protein [Planctomycetota bacterium]
MKDGVTPENNAASELLKVVGPSQIAPDESEQFFKSLGIPQLPAEGDYFLRWEDWRAYLLSQRHDIANLSEDQKKALLEPLMGEIGQLNASFEQATLGPWKSAENPIINEWLEANDIPLQAVAKAVEIPRFFLPVIRSGPRKPLDVNRVGVRKNVEDLALALNVRAMRNLGEGKEDTAWKDLQIATQIGQLFNTSSLGTDGWIGSEIELQAIRSMLIYLAKTEPDAAFCQTQLAKLSERMANAVPMAQRLDTAERMEMLDAVCLEAKGVERASYNGLPPNNPILVDWNFQLKFLNQKLDNAIKAAAVVDPRQRQLALQSFDSEIEQLRSEFLSWEEEDSSHAGRKTLTNQSFAEWLVTERLPLVVFLVGYESQVQTNRNLLRLALALAWYKAEIGKYPAALTDLVPKFLPAIPVDDFHGHPFSYQLKPDGYLLYSFGQNGIDEQGANAESDPSSRADDITARVPAVKPVPPPKE